jgi:class 3 adenylate cyclase/pimeloyl-ACP methyl ester carboxylesterase
VAYQVLGEGSPDLLFCNGIGSHIDIGWEAPLVPEFWQRMSEICRPIIFDRRGTGGSDAAPDHLSTWEEWAEDIGAVLDAVGSTEAVLQAQLDAGPPAMLFAALHPERVKALILVNTAARYLVGDDYPIGFAPEAIGAMVDLIAQSWGTPEFVGLASPGLSGNADAIRTTARILRASATPRAAAHYYDYILRQLDVRQALPLIHSPTLVLHRRDNPLIPSELVMYLAEHIDGARLVELPGTDLGAISMDVFEEVAEFLTGARPAVEIESVLTTVLFTDIVESTRQAAALGDRRWLARLDSHNRAVRDQLQRFRGKEIETTGDGFVASFDGPARAVHCAQSIVETNKQLGIEIRAGLHTGECQVTDSGLGGISVHIAARVGALAGSGQVLVSGTVKDLVVGSDIKFSDQGEHELKGVPGSWKIFAVQP